MPIDPLPSLDRTSPTFKTDVDTFFATQLPAFSVQAEAARVVIVSAESTATAAASTATAQATISTTGAGTATAQAGTATTQAGIASAAAAAAAASAASITAQVSTAIHGASSKATPVDADELGLTDSAASFGLKKLTWANLKAGIWAALGTLIAAGTGKATPVDADSFAIADSAASSATRQLTWVNLKATLKTYFDTLYITKSNAPTSFRADNNGAALNIPTGTWTRLALSTERHDTNNEFASGTFTAKKAGVHRFYAQWAGASPIAGNTWSARLYLNGSPIATGNVILSAALSPTAPVTIEIDLAVGNTVDFYALHDRGTNMVTSGDTTLTFFCGGYIGA